MRGALGRTHDRQFHKSSTTLDQFAQAIEQASRRYFQLVIIVGDLRLGQDKHLAIYWSKDWMQGSKRKPRVEQKMLELTRTQRSRQVEKLLKSS